jgi:hypothetical protein
MSWNEESNLQVFSYKDLGNIGDLNKKIKNLGCLGDLIFERLGGNGS